MKSYLSYKRFDDERSFSLTLGELKQEYFIFKMNHTDKTIHSLRNKNSILIKYVHLIQINKIKKKNTYLNHTKKIKMENEIKVDYRQRKKRKKNFFF